MFNFGKNKDDMNDPQKALDHGQKDLEHWLDRRFDQSLHGQGFCG